MKLGTIVFFTSDINFPKNAKTVCLVFFVLLFLSCKNEENNSTCFKSDFKNTSQNLVVEKQFQVNNIQDWQISDHKIVCIESKENRNVRLLTHTISEKPGNFEMTVKLGFLNTEISNLNTNWAGFIIGSKSLEKNTISGKGLAVGVCTNGALFIGNPSLNNRNNVVINSLKNEVKLKLLVHFKHDKYSIDFSVIDVNTKQKLSNISKTNIAPEQLTGDLVLVSNFKNNSNKVNKSTKSVWFKDWEIKGSKIAVKTINQEQNIVSK